MEQRTLSVKTPAHSINMDGRKTVTGNKKANFFVYYEVDSDVVKHNLTMEDYGEEDRWVLLEPAA